jgi:hypothetical protein
VILLYLLCVVVDELADVGLCERDLGEDLVGGGGPGERVGVGVPVGDLVADLRDEGFDRGEGAAAGGLAGDDAERGLDLVDPRGADRGEVGVDVWVVCELLLHLRLSEEGGETARVQGLGAVAGRPAFAVDLAGADVQCGERVRCAVPDVVVAALT